MAGSTQETQAGDLEGTDTRKDPGSCSWRPKVGDRPVHPLANLWAKCGDGCVRAVRLAAEGGLEAALAAGYSRRSVFRWNRLYRAGGIIALLPQSRSRREAQAAVP